VEEELTTIPQAIYIEKFSPYNTHYGPQVSSLFELAMFFRARNNMT
jgi:hypothetical protein